MAKGRQSIERKCTLALRTKVPRFLPLRYRLNNASVDRSIRKWGARDRVTADRALGAIIDLQIGWERCLAVLKEEKAND